jgi:hypothetical protein
MREGRRGQFVLHMSVAASLVCTRPMTSLCTSPSAEAKRTVSNAGSLLSSSHVPSFGASTFKMEDESVRRLSRCWSVCLEALKECMLVSHLGARVQSRACFGGCGYDGSAAAGPSPSTAPLHRCTAAPLLHLQMPQADRRADGEAGQKTALREGVARKCRARAAASVMVHAQFPNGNFPPRWTLQVPFVAEREEQVWQVCGRCG